MTREFSQFNFASRRREINRRIEERVRRKREIIFGRRALNRQVPGYLQAPTEDTDVYTTNPRTAAHETQRELDRRVAGGRDEFFVRDARHPGTKRVFHHGPDQMKNTRDDVPIADFSRKPKRVDTVKIDGIMFESIGSIERGKKKILRDKSSSFRHEKDRADLDRILVSRRTKKNFNGSVLRL